MSDNIRIKTTPGSGSKSVNLKINQKFDFIEILSLKISQEEAYRRFCSDYGVIVGRVIVNNGVGVPNAKVSIFVPIDEIDINDSEIFGLYPYERITDTNDKGVPYNLLPRNNRGKDNCFSPIGTFPSKREIQDNPEMSSIYCDYYKFTVTTNVSGDFMIFGVPVGTHTMHVNADISDIGELSQRPYDLIREGASPDKFRSTTKFRGRDENPLHQFYKNNQLKTTSPISVTVPPFWGDTEECDVGIARADVDLATNITPQAIFMGSIISDNDKHAVSRICRPRAKLGKMDEVVTGEGTIEMIRKNNNDEIERFDVEGGQLIDGDGAWAYQIPMDRDFMVTDEKGNFIPSEDPTKGIATKAKVRFRIGMDTQGDEGRLRTRAKFLVPHNPDTWDDTDFNFNEQTNDKHFYELSWNKIYTVKNHITRTQPFGTSELRNFIGLKNVDDPGGKNPFPFNRLDNKPNYLFWVLCILVRILARIVNNINFIMIPIVNLIIMAINTFLRAICNLFHIVGFGLCFAVLTPMKYSCRKQYCMGSLNSSIKCDCKDIVSYVPYILLACAADESGKKYAPGGRWRSSKKHVLRRTWDATYYSVDPDTEQVTETDFWYVNDDRADSQCTLLQRASIEGCDAGWSKCQTTGLAEALDVFRFDFYNDWINGSLYSFLLKYKIKGRGVEKFCEVDCRKTGDSGVDGNNDGEPDNKCRRNYILDTCTGSLPQNSGSATATSGIDAVSRFDRIKTRSGYIKKHDGELYYSPVTKDGNLKLYATDIVNLGSVFDCDWEGEPVFYKYLTDTTFNIPPLMAQYEPTEIEGASAGPISVTGFDTSLGVLGDFSVFGISVGIGTLDILKSGLIGNLTCAGFLTNSNNCNNIRRLSELGMGLDERRGDIPNIIPVNNKIGNEDVEGDYIRGLFSRLNSTSINNIESILIDEISYYDYKDKFYYEFRAPDKSKDVWVYKNSYYFYFGLNKGKSALSKMKLKYFSECTPEPDIDFFVIANNITSDLSSDGSGSITVEASGGIGPYNFFWSGPTIDGISYPVTNTFSNELNPINSITDLYAGTYFVTVTDSVGNVNESAFVIPGVPKTQCEAQKTDVTINGGSDGEVTVNISNGKAPYKVEFYTYDLDAGAALTPVEPPISISTSSVGFTGLKEGYYNLIVTDSSTPETSCNSVIKIDEPQALDITLITNNVVCHGESTGSIKANISGGVGPFKFKWKDSSGTVLAPTFTLISDLKPDTYYLELEDEGASSTYTESTTISEPGPIIYDTPITIDGNCNSSIASVEVNNISGGNGGPYESTLSLGVFYSEVKTGTDVTFDNSGHPDGLDEAAYNGQRYTLTIKDVSGCTVSEDVRVFNPLAELEVKLTKDSSSSQLTATISGGVYKPGPLFVDKFYYKIRWFYISGFDPGTYTPIFTPLTPEKDLTGSNDVFNLPPALPEVPDLSTSDPSDTKPAPAIIYAVMVLDKNGVGCKDTAVISVPQDY